MGAFATQAAGVQVTAVVWPRCVCGLSYGQHVPAGCSGYKPSRPVQDIGTIGYTPRPGMALRKKVVAVLMYQAERLLQTAARRLRYRREAM